MNQVIKKTLGGLDGGYYFRQFLFGLIFPAFFYAVYSQDGYQFGMPPTLLLLSIINSLLYPYSRFVYEQIVNFIFGENVFFVNAILLLVIKFMTMLHCWMFAIFVAPIGLAYLYYYHTRNGN